MTLLLAAPCAGQGQDPMLESAMAAEIARSTTSLQEPGYPLPYYVSLRVVDTRSEDLRCEGGGVRFEDGQWQRVFGNDVRVGGYDLDNHPLAPAENYDGEELPQGDETAVRRALWLKLDEEYKSGAAGFLRKQALRVRRGKTEYDTDDMTRETPLAKDFPDPAAGRDFGADSAAARSLCLAASAAFRASPELRGSMAGLSRRYARDWIRDSEGGRVRYAQAWTRLDLYAESVSPDGMKLKAAKSFYAPTLAGLPSEAQAAAGAAEVAADLKALAAAASTSPFNAPALVDPSVGAAVLQALAVRLSGEEQRNPDGAQTFRDKLGKPVLPSFLSLDDDPTLAEFHGTPLTGHLDVDDQGVEARKVALVEGGVLRNYLLSRYPVLGFDRSNGHARAAPGMRPMGRASTLILRSTQAYSSDRLMDRLRAETAKRGLEFGLYIKKARVWSQQDKTGQQQAFRLVPVLVYLVEAKTGKLTLVRDLDMVGTPINLVSRILAVGDDPSAENSVVEQPSGALPVSTVCPTLLLQEVELQRAETKPEKPFILPAP